jgi:hypothetical protein
MEEKKTVPKIMKQTRKKSILEIYNNIFTYFYSHTQIA